MQSNPSIIIVGAGISGLYAGVMLKEEGYHVTVLEANTTFGGRVKSNIDFAGVPLELGAEYIHGKRSLLYEYMEQIAVPIYQFKEKIRFYLGNQTILKEKEAYAHEELNEVLDFFDNQWRYEGDEIIVAEFIEQFPNLAKHKAILEGFAAEYGTTLNKLGMQSLAIEEKKWLSGGKNYKIEGTMTNALAPLAKALTDDIHYNQTVEYVGYGNKEVIVTTTKGKKFKADAILITVPLTMLKQNAIHFDPPLSAQKIQAANGIGMDDGLKVFLRFDSIFWDEKMTDLYGASLVPAYIAAGVNEYTKAPILNAYVMGEKATALKQQSTPLHDILLKELDEIYGNKLATKHYEDMLVMDWGSELYIQGCYSYASPNIIGYRNLLAKPIHQKVYFAGEHTNTFGHSSTLHGAMESAYRAVEEITDDFPTENATNDTA